MFKLLLMFGFVSSAVGRYEHYGDKKEWDVILFTQNWPVTECLQWKHDDPQNGCNMPHSTIWTIHGMWPTKLGTKGPGYCNRNLKFDMSEIEGIIEPLSERWLSVHDGTNADESFWKHEWEKHGSCAAQLESLNSEIKYFSQGLNWNNEFNMSSILNEAGLAPGGPGQTIDSIFSSVQTAIGADPFISCYKHKSDDKTYLIDIRVCFDKSLSLVDCDGVERREDEHPLTQDCPENTPIYYPKSSRLYNDIGYQLDNHLQE